MVGQSFRFRRTRPFVMMVAALLIAGSLHVVSSATTPREVRAVSSGFVSRVGQRLMLDGSEFRFSGVNMFNANSDGYCGQDYTDQQLADAFDEISAGDDVVVRAWFFQPMAASKAPGVTHEWSGARDWTRFDRMLAIASTHHVRVIPVLTDHGGECGDFGTTGIKPASFYETGYTEPNPDELARYDHWVSYRDWVQEVVSRYRDDPTVLFWQLINEAEVNPDYPAACPPGTGPGDILRAWADDVSTVVRSLDSNHLISLGTIGSGQCGAGSTAEYQRIHDLPNIDLCEVHDYDQTSDMSGDIYNGLATRLDACRALDKPLFVGEVGLIPTVVGGTLDARATKFRAKLLRQEAAGVVGHLAWAYMRSGSTIDNYDIGPGDPALVVLREAPMFTVNSTDDVNDGACDVAHCSLREAVNGANGNPGLDTVAFDFRTTTGPTPTISLTSALPTIDQPTVVDGTSEPWFGIVQLDGSAVANADGLVVAAGGSRIQGLSIGGFSAFARAAIVLSGNGHSRVVGNAIGLDATLGSLTPNRLGVLVLSPENVIGAPGTPNVIGGNLDHGIKVGMAEQPTLDTHGNVIQSNFIGYSPGIHGGEIIAAPNYAGIELNTTTGTVVGGTGPDEGNTISGNANAGILVTSPNNTIVGNRIGTDETGTIAVPNSDGIAVALASGNLIGGTDPGAGNLISGNATTGIQVDGPDTVNTRIYGNRIGTDATGMTAIPNGLYGVVLTGYGVSVGDVYPGSGNVISGNNNAGLVLGTNAIANSIFQNLIGVAADGVSPLPNGHGIFSGGPNNHSNRIAWQGSGGTNTIAFNLGYGIGVGEGTSALNIWSNRIFSNGSLGIDLGLDGPTPNDLNDTDNGPNDLPNAPVLTAATSGTSTTINGVVDGAPGTSWITVDFYDNVACDASGYGEGETPLGSVLLFADPNGDVAFTFDPSTYLPGSFAPLGHFVTATATHHLPIPGDETSEFSACAVVTRGSESASGNVVAGGTLTTDTEGDGATPTDPVETSVTPSASGPVSIDEQASTVPAPVGFSLIGYDVAISAPPGTPSSPIRIALRLDASAVPAGYDETTLQLLRNGLSIPDCSVGDGTATPDPCLTTRSRLADGDILLVALTSNASLWQLATVNAYAFSGFAAPVDNPPVINSAKAGQAIPVKFSLGGDFGLEIFATGSPGSQSYACASGTYDTIETVASSGQSGLSYDPSSGLYTYVWKTAKSWAGTCRRLSVKLDDGSTHVAGFWFKK